TDDNTAVHLSPFNPLASGKLPRLVTGNPLLEIDCERKARLPREDIFSSRLPEPPHDKSSELIQFRHQREESLQRQMNSRIGCQFLPKENDAVATGFHPADKSL